VFEESRPKHVGEGATGESLGSFGWEGEKKEDGRTKVPMEKRRKEAPKALREGR